MFFARKQKRHISFTLLEKQKTPIYPKNWTSDKRYFGVTVLLISENAFHFCHYYIPLGQKQKHYVTATM